MLKKVFLYCILLNTVSINAINAQALRFSQFFNAPLLVNPANTGFLPDNDYRLGAHYREQWSSISVPYKTFSAYGDFQVLRNLISSGWFGVGGMILRDIAGTASLNSTKAYTSIAYHQMLGSSGLLSAGFNFGYTDKRLITDSLKFESMWDGNGFNRPLPAEISNFRPINNFDLQFGLNYALFPTDNFYLHLGFSAHHINKPKESFFTSVNNNIVQPRYIYFADAVYKPNEQVIISPGIYYTHQAKASEFVGGMHLNYNVSGNGDQQLILGAYVRPGDAIIPMLGYQWGNFKFSFTYDITTSSLKSFNNGMGANEMYLQYNGLYTLLYVDRQSFCPNFKN